MTSKNHVGLCKMEHQMLIVVIGLIVTPLYAMNLFILKKMSNLCERIAKEETKSDIYHKDNS